MISVKHAFLYSVLAIAAAACSKANSAPTRDKASAAPAADEASAPPASAKATAAPASVAPGGATANDAPAAIPCDAKAINDLSKNLATANHLEVDLSDKKLEKEGNDMAAKLQGKRYSFKGCTFASQGNDELQFGAKGTDKTLTCSMKGGEKGLDNFRNAAMELDTDKMKLDVTGVIALGGMQGFERLQLTECTVTPHE